MFAIPFTRPDSHTDFHFSILDDTPCAHQPVRLFIIDSLAHLESAVHQLQFTKLVLMLSIVQNFQQHLRVYNTFPAIDDMDNTSDSEP